MKFNPAQFTPTQWATAEQKAKAGEAVIRFLEAGCPEAKFTKGVYHTLSDHLFSHIAHYNAGGFYATWFATSAVRAEWVRYVRSRARRGWYGDPAYTWSDVEPVIADWLETSGVGDRFVRAAEDDFENRERAELVRLSAKYAA
jgi:hypothetical protein